MTVHMRQERSVDSLSNMVVQQMSRLADSIKRISFLDIRFRSARFYLRSKASRNWIIGSVDDCHRKNIQRDESDGRIGSSLELRQEQSHIQPSKLV